MKIALIRHYQIEIKKREFKYIYLKKDLIELIYF